MATDPRSAVALSLLSCFDFSGHGLVRKDDWKDGLGMLLMGDFLGATDDLWSTLCKKAIDLAGLLCTAAVWYCRPCWQRIALAVTLSPLKSVGPGASEATQPLCESTNTCEMSGCLRMYSSISIAGCSRFRVVRLKSCDAPRERGALSLAHTHEACEGRRTSPHGT